MNGNIKWDIYLRERQRKGKIRESMKRYPLSKLFRHSLSLSVSLSLSLSLDLQKDILVLLQSLILMMIFLLTFFLRIRFVKKDQRELQGTENLLRNCEEREKKTLSSLSSPFSKKHIFKRQYFQFETCKKIKSYLEGTLLN